MKECLFEAIADEEMAKKEKRDRRMEEKTCLPFFATLFFFLLGFPIIPPFVEYLFFHFIGKSTEAFEFPCFSVVMFFLSGLSAIWWLKSYLFVRRNPYADPPRRKRK